MENQQHMSKLVPLFESHSLSTFGRAKATFVGRGDEYGDTWRLCQFIKMKAVARELKLNIPDSCFRALATAAFADMKYWRLLGSYKEDSLIDGINYDAFLAEEMRQLLWPQSPAEPVKDTVNDVIIPCTPTAH